MTIEIERLEARIYCSHYIGLVTVQEIMGGIVEKMAADADEVPYVLILDMTELRQLDFDLLQLREADKSYTMLATLVVGTPVWLAHVINILKLNSALRMEEFATIEAAQARGREIRDAYLKERQESAKS